MSNKYWIDKTDGVDTILAENFNSAFAGIESDIAQKANKFVETEISNINEKLEQKADKTSVDAALEQKADKTIVDEINVTLEQNSEALSVLKQRSIPHTKVSGYPISLTDNLEGESVIDYKVYGNSVQDGIPSPDSPIEIESVGDLVTDKSSENYGKYDIPVTVCGKNLIPYPYYRTTTTLNGITFTDNGDGTITANGTATAASQFFFYYKISTPSDMVSISSPMVLSGCPSGGSYTGYKLGIDIYDEDDNRRYYFDYGDSCQIPAGKSSICYIVIPTGITVSNLVFKPQLELGSTSTPYELYKGETKHVYLDEPLRKVGDYADYIDYKNQSVVRQIKVLDITGTKTIDESFELLETPTSESITAPDFTVPNSEVMNVSSGTTISPSSIDLTYYQDINKVITELKNAILAQGGNV